MGIGLDKGVHGSITSISDPQMSPSASESTSFCAGVKCAVKRGSLFVVCTFRLRRSCASRTAWSCTSHARTPRVISDEFKKKYFSLELQVVHSPSNDVRAA